MGHSPRDTKPRHNPIPLIHANRNTTTTGYAPKLFAPIYNNTRTKYVIGVNAIAK